MGQVVPDRKEQNTTNRKICSKRGYRESENFRSVTHFIDTYFKIQNPLSKQKSDMNEYIIHIYIPNKTLIKNNPLF